MAVDDSYTKLLLHMDGADNGITFTDEAGKTITPGNQSCTKTGIKKFGTASAYFDGAFDYLLTPLVADLQFGTEDFTIDCWTYLLSRASYYPCLFSNLANWTTGSIGLFIGHNAASNKYRVYIDSASVLLTSTNNIIYNEWAHIALVRSGNDYKLYINGTNDGSGSSTSAINGNGSNFFISASGDIGSHSSLYGYVDEFRVSKGIARWTTNFTPPTSPYGPPTIDKRLILATFI